MADKSSLHFSTAHPDGSYPPTTTLHRLAEDGHWNEIYWRINGIDWDEIFHPFERYSNVCPADFVERVQSCKGFLVFPNVSASGLPPIPEFSLGRATDGKLPFHIAVDNYAPTFAAVYLLGRDMDLASHYVDGFGLPLHYVCSRAKMDMPQERLSDLISALLDRFPQACAIRSPSGDYPLHALMHRKAPPELLELFFTLDSDAACVSPSTEYICSLTDHFGRVPLHIALERGAPWGTVATLVRMNPSSIHATSADGKTPIDVSSSMSRAELMSLASVSTAPDDLSPVCGD